MTGCWSVFRDAVRGYSTAEADKLSIPERRRRTSRRVANGARVVYLSIQLVCLTILLRSDSILGSSWRSANPTYAWCFLALLGANLVLYTFLCSSDPGFLPVRETDVETSPLLDNTSANSSATTGPASREDIPNSRQAQGAPSYQPLPYPTNYANYINLSALGRSSQQQSGAAAQPWWDLPNPGSI